MRLWVARPNRARLFHCPTVAQNRPHPALERLRDAPGPRPLVAGHRGDSRHHPENTLAAFRAAATAPVAIQEFDVRQLADGTLVCLHDATLDRTTDSTARLGPDVAVASTDLPTLRRLDAGRWFSAAHTAEPVPTLAEALAVMLPASVPLIEHKAGSAADYVAELRRLECCEQVVLQSFDWPFLAEVHGLAPEIALGALGPTRRHALPDENARAQMRSCGAGLVHWRAEDLDATLVEHLHATGMLVCSYTTDDAHGWRRGQSFGIDAMCTNDPHAMVAFLTNR